MLVAHRMLMRFPFRTSPFFVFPGFFLILFIVFWRCSRTKSVEDFWTVNLCVTHGKPTQLPPTHLFIFLLLFSCLYCHSFSFFCLPLTPPIKDCSHFFTSLFLLSFFLRSFSTLLFLLHFLFFCLHSKSFFCF